MDDEKEWPLGISNGGVFGALRLRTPQAETRAALLRLLIFLIGSGSYSGLLMGEKREGLLVHLAVDAYHDNGIFEVWIARIHR